jgi:nuclear pore complex protein Nup155
LGYFETCLEIFQAADFRRTSEILQCWEAIIKQGLSIRIISLTLEHDRAKPDEANKSFEGVADAIRRLGRKFLKYEQIFNPSLLVPLIEKYNFDTVQRDAWVPEAFLDAGVAHQTLFTIYDNINIRQEAPWNEGPAKLLVITDLVWSVRSWIDAYGRSARTERGRFPAERVLASLERILTSVGASVAGKKLRDRIITLRTEIQRRF